MVYRGKPSPGCNDCRKSKKKCDLARPICTRCQRIGKPCTYRDIDDLVILDESESVIRRAKAKATPTVTPTPVSNFSSPLSVSSDVTVLLSRPGTPSDSLTICPLINIPDDSLAMGLFFSQFVGSGHFSYFSPLQHRDIGHFQGLEKAILACGLATLSHRRSSPRALEQARKHYTDAVVLIGTSLQNRHKVAEDDTVLTVMLLGLFENLAADSMKSIESWQAHIRGATEVLRIRGRGQLDNPLGAAVFRELRSQIVLNCLWVHRAVPQFVVEYSDILAETATPDVLPADRLMHIVSNFARLRSQTGSQGDSATMLLETTSLYQDLLEWFDQTTAADTSWTFTEMHLVNIPHSRNAIYHYYRSPQVFRSWNWARSICILLSRMQQASTASAGHDPSAEYATYIVERQHMADDICNSVPYALGVRPEQAQSDTVPMLGAYALIMPLFMAGTVLLEQVQGHAPPVRTDCEAQLAHIIESLEYIGGVLGIHWSYGFSMMLKNPDTLKYDTLRQRFVRMEHGIEIPVA